MIVLRDLWVRRGSRVLLEGAHLHLNPGEKVGLVGRNGTGKSTLFALFRGQLHEDKGNWSMPAHWQIGHVAQDMPETSDTATEFVLQGDARLIDARNRLTDAVAHQHNDMLGQAYADLQDAGDSDANARAQTLLAGLGFAPHQWSHSVHTFSGGWRMRLQLARALMCPSDLLLLDEPTNHLDLDALVWLEGWLKKYSGTLIVISHDREFLDAVSDVTVHLDRAQLTRYGGNYSRFEEMRAQAMLQQQAAFQRQQDRVAHLQSFIDRFKAKATKAKQAQSRVKALERMQMLGPVTQDAEFRFQFQPSGQAPNPMLTTRDLVVGYLRAQDDPVRILKNVACTVMPGQRIGVLGANGQGKSTLIKTLVGQLDALGGDITRGKGLRVGYFAQQEMDLLEPDDTPLLFMQRTAKHLTELGELTGQSTREQDLRSYLGGFSFSNEQVHQTVQSLSGGEKARLLLASMVWARPNLLVLDEPTNHLDLVTRDALADALNDFEGAVILVSHDRALLRRVCEEFWLVTQGHLQSFDGDLEDYQAWVLAQAKAAMQSIRESTGKAKPNAPAVKPASKAGPSKNQIKIWQSELESVQTTLSKVEQDIAQHTEWLQHPGTQHPIVQTAAALAQLVETRDQLENRWLELSEKLESINLA